MRKEKDKHHSNNLPLQLQKSLINEGMTISSICSKYNINCASHHSYPHLISLKYKVIPSKSKSTIFTTTCRTTPHSTKSSFENVEALSWTHQITSPSLLFLISNSLIMEKKKPLVILIGPRLRFMIN